MFTNNSIQQKLKQSANIRTNEVTKYGAPKLDVGGEKI
jgi:hypothetical protein